MRILSFFFFLSLLAINSFAQEESEKKIKPKRTDNYIRMKGLRIGTDLTRPFQDLWTKGNRHGYEFTADLELWPNVFPNIETGYEVMEIQTPYVDYTGQGAYTRIGMDYNLLEAQTKIDKDIFYVGLRYGFSIASQQLNQYTIDYYWGQTSGSYPVQNFVGHWGEIVFGIKGEILRNFYMGWSVRGKVKFNQPDVGMPPVYFIPGYGKTENGFVVDFTYSVYYNIPWDFRKNIGEKKTTTSANSQTK
jgi:hypothetical protein